MVIVFDPVISFLSQVLVAMRGRWGRHLRRKHLKLIIRLLHNLHTILLDYLPSPNPKENGTRVEKKGTRRVAKSKYYYWR